MVRDDPQVPRRALLTACVRAATGFVDAGYPGRPATLKHLGLDGLEAVLPDGHQPAFLAFAFFFVVRAGFFSAFLPA